ALVNEFHDPESGFHQIDLFFRCRITGGQIDAAWRDPEMVVDERRFFSLTELRNIRLKPDSLPDVAFGGAGPARYDPLEAIVP
ncbi:MAG: NUDIX hydrolase, partial [Paracoccaceae bacterium]